MTNKMSKFLFGLVFIGTVTLGGTHVMNLDNAYAVEAAPEPVAPESSLFPADAKPGHCYTRITIPAKYEIVMERVLIREEGKRMAVTQPEFSWVEEQQMVKATSTQIEVIPAVYKDITEKILISPDKKQLIAVPAEYKTVSEQVLDKPAHSIWKRGTKHIANALDVKSDDGTGEVMCLVAVPATYKTVIKTVLLSPAGVKEVVIAPAKYEEVKRTLVETPASTREIKIPAEYKTVKVLKQIKAGESKEVVLPADYAEVKKQRTVSEKKLEWHEVLCDVNMTRRLVTDLQKLLQKAGFFRTEADGTYGAVTQRAVNKYAEKNKLPNGINYVTLALADHIGLEYKK